MKVTIKKGEQSAVDVGGTVYQIEGIEVIRQNTKEKIFYDKGTSFYKAVTHVGVKFKSVLLDNGKIMLK